MSVDLNRERPYQPIEPRVWQLGKMETSLKAIEDSTSLAHQQGIIDAPFREFLNTALYSVVSKQASASGDAEIAANVLEQTCPDFDADKWEVSRNGGAEPNELIRFERALLALPPAGYDGPNLEPKNTERKSRKQNRPGVELARTTHVGIWDVTKEIHEPVQQSIVNDAELDTRPGKSEVHYVPRMDEITEAVNALIVTRKQLHTTHWHHAGAQQGEVWTMIGQTVAIDFSKMEKDDLEKMSVVRAMIKTIGNESVISRKLGEVLEPFIGDTVKLQPEWNIPLVTTYYAKPGPTLLR